MGEAIEDGDVGDGVALPALPSIADWLVSLVPVNPIAAAANGAMLPLVVFTIAFGLALGRVATATREAGSLVSIASKIASEI